MSVNPSPIGGYAGQFFDNNGQPLSGGKIYTYAAGTTTPQATYTSAAGVTPHSNPIVLDSAGRVPGGEIWLTDGLVYKFVIETSLAILIGTYDNITGVNSNFVNYTVQEEVITATAGQTVFNLSTINYTPGTNSLTVYIDGVNQYVGDSYLETDSNTVTFTSGVHVGGEVKFTTAVQSTTGAVNADIVAYDPPFTGGVATNVQTKLDQYVSVKDFGAVGDGVTDDSAAFAAAIAYANTQFASATGSGFPVGTATIVVPSGDYVVDTGVTCSTLMCEIIGDGRESTRIIVGASQYFLTVTSEIYQFKMSGISFVGGKGAFAHTYTGVNVHGIIEISDNNFNDYTECAVGTLSSDYPYWRVKNNVFRGSSSLTSKGVVFSGNPDLCVIEDNAFLCNLYHVKIKQAQNTKVERNDFIRFVSGGNSPVLTDVWIVPHTSYVNSGSGFSCTDNKFGNENLSTNDFRILIADEGSGTNAFDKNHSTSVSTGFLVGPTIDNYVASVSGQTRGFIYSYTPNVRDVAVKNTWAGLYPYVIQYDAGVTVSNDRVNDSNMIDVSMILDASEGLAPVPTSTAQNTSARDPLGVLSGTSSFSQNHMTGFDPGLVDLWTEPTSGVNKFTKITTTSTPITDSTGDADAAEFTFGVGGFTYGYAANPANGKLIWAEIEVAAASSASLSELEIRVQCDNGEVLMKRFVRVPATWQRFRFPFVVRALASPASLQIVPVNLAVGSADKVKLGRARVYQAAEPTDFGARYLQALKTYNPGTIASGSSASTTITCTGAALGDFALVSFGVDLLGLTANAYVSATDTVTIRLYNNTGSGVTIGSSVTRVKVVKSVDYAL